MSPAELREALDALGGGDGATPRFSMSEMHDASEVLGEIFTCLHRCGRSHRQNTASHMHTWTGGRRSVEQLPNLSTAKAFSC